MSTVYGIIGEFAEPDRAIAAARQLRDTGFNTLDAYSPYAVEELDELIRPGGTIAIPFVVCLGALFGAGFGYWIQYYTAAVSYPLNIGGRPLDSWPAFTVSAFEITVLCALTAGFVAFLAASRLPLLYHPIFAASGFERASQDRIVLCIEAGDMRWHPERIRSILARHGAIHVSEVRV